MSEVQAELFHFVYKTATSIFLKRSTVLQEYSQNKFIIKSFIITYMRLWQKLTTRSFVFLAHRSACSGSTAVVVPSEARWSEQKQKTLQSLNEPHRTCLLWGRLVSPACESSPQQLQAVKDVKTWRVPQDNLCGWGLRACPHTTARHRQLLSRLVWARFKEGRGHLWLTHTSLTAHLGHRDRREPNCGFGEIYEPQFLIVVLRLTTQEQQRVQTLSSFMCIQCNNMTSDSLLVRQHHVGDSITEILWNGSC